MNNEDDTIFYGRVYGIFIRPDPEFHGRDDDAEKSVSSSDSALLCEIGLSQLENDKISSIEYGDVLLEVNHCKSIELASRIKA